MAISTKTKPKEESLVKASEKFHRDFNSMEEYLNSFGIIKNGMVLTVPKEKAKHRLMEAFESESYKQEFKEIDWLPEEKAEREAALPQVVWDKLLQLAKVDGFKIVVAI